MAVMQRRKVVRLDLSPLRKMEGDLRSAGRSDLDAMYKRWSARYLGFVQRRFDRYSKGAGSWPPLAQSTVRSRRKGGKKRGGVNNVQLSKNKTGGKAAILRDTGTLFNALDVGAKNNTARIKNGVRVGFLQRRPAKKRDADGSTKPADISIGRLAEIHQFGQGKVPARPIIVEPDRQTQNGMLRDAQKALRGMLRRHSLR